MRIGEKKPAILQVMAALKKLNYAASYAILSTHEFALPQRRHRVYVWTRGAPAKRVLQWGLARCLLLHACKFASAVCQCCVF